MYPGLQLQVFLLHQPYAGEDIGAQSIKLLHHRCCHGNHMFIGKRGGGGGGGGGKIGYIKSYEISKTKTLHHKQVCVPFK